MPKHWAQRLLVSCSVFSYVLLLVLHQEQQTPHKRYKRAIGPPPPEMKKVVHLAIRKGSHSNSLISVSNKPKNSAAKPNSSTRNQSGTGKKPVNLTRSSAHAVLRNPLPPSVEDDPFYFLADELATTNNSLSPPDAIQPASNSSFLSFTVADLLVFRRVFEWLRSAPASCFHLVRLGGRGRGARPACTGASLTLGGHPCLAYTLGADPSAAFVRQLSAMGCEMHVMEYDVPKTVTNASANANAAVSTMPALKDSRQLDRRLWVHHLNAKSSQKRGLDDSQLFTFQDIVSELGHVNRTIQYLHADLNGLETEMLIKELMNLQASSAMALDQVEQLSLAIHLRPEPEKQLVFYRRLLKTLQALESRGFSRVKSLRRSRSGLWRFPGVAPPVMMVYEILLVKPVSGH